MNWLWFFGGMFTGMIVLLAIEYLIFKHFMVFQ